MSLLLAAAGGLFGVLFALNTVAQLPRQTPKVGFWQTLLAFLTVLLVLAALVSGVLNGDGGTVVRRMALALAAGLGIIGLAAIGVEARRPQRLKGSRGVLSVGVAALVALAAVSVPRSASRLLVTPTPFQLPTPSATISVDATSSGTPTPTDTATATLTRTPRPTGTATQPPYASRTPTPTATLPAPCTAIVNYNLNLRTAPDLAAPILLSIPYDTAITVFWRNADSTWWFATYAGEEGWVDGQYMRLDAACASLPERKTG